MKNEFFLELTGLNDEIVYIKGSSIVGIMQKMNQSHVFVNGDNIPFKVKNKAKQIFDLMTEASRKL